MATYAMICNDRLIDVIHDCTSIPVWPPDPSGHEVVAIECLSDVTREHIYNPVTKEIEKPLITIANEPRKRQAHEIYTEEEPLTESEERQIDTLLNTEYIACLLELQLA